MIRIGDVGQNTSGYTVSASVVDHSVGVGVDCSVDEISVGCVSIEGGDAVGIGRGSELAEGVVAS